MPSSLGGPPGRYTVFAAAFPASVRSMGILALLAAVALLPHARACEITDPDPEASFGSESSLHIGTVEKTTSAQPHAGINCPGPTLLGILGTDRVDVTPTSVHDARVVHAASGDSVTYRLFADEAYQEELFLGQTNNYYNSYILGLLGILGGGTADFPMYFRTVPSSAENLSAGVYFDTLTLQWDWVICTIALLGLCIGQNSGSGTSVITLELEITPDCLISAPDLDFGTAPLVAGFSPVTQTLSVTCTKDSEYGIGLSDGSHADGATRRMHHDGHYLEYQLYKGASGTERWGDTGAERRSSAAADLNPGNYDGLTGQGFDYRAVILPGQSTPPQGTYTDSIVVDVSF